VRLGFVQRIRDERAFDGPDALRAQIQNDVERARALFDRMSL
jgi:FAD synthase